jgi:DNA (cytosine-5)-methyltransferase 3A
MKVLSLFDGISCGMIALERANIKVDEYFASEINEDSIKISKHNYPKIKHIGNIEDINYYHFGKDNVFGEIDLIIAGSPCQSFSIAGNREGFDGKSKLFFEFIRVLKQVKPKYFLLENVKMKKEWEDIITSTLKEIYPETKVYNINSKLVSAQLRNRFYWTNVAGGGQVEQPEDKGILLQDILDHGYTDREKSRAILESESRPLVNMQNMWHRYHSTGFTTIVFRDSDVYNKAINYKPNVGRGGESCDYHQFKEGDIRYFSQKELERLQTLPEGYTKALNRNKAAGVIGDGWTVDVIAHILSYINKQK